MDTNPASDSDACRSEFRRLQYVVLESVLAPIVSTPLYNYIMNSAASGTQNPLDTQVEGTPSAYADPITERLLRIVLPTIEFATGLLLYPTYSYWRLYKRGDVLDRHRDRPACEITVSLNVGQRLEKAWPLIIQGPEGTAEIELAPGDAVIFRGVECAHWRTCFTGTHVAQVFLHYVDRDGPFRDWKFDKRPELREERTPNEQ